MRIQVLEPMRVQGRSLVGLEASRFANATLTGVSKSETIAFPRAPVVEMLGADTSSGCSPESQLGGNLVGFLFFGPVRILNLERTS